MWDMENKGHFVAWLSHHRPAPLACTCSPHRHTRLIGLSGPYLCLVQNFRNPQAAGGLQTQGTVYRCTLSINPTHAFHTGPCCSAYCSIPETMTSHATRRRTCRRSLCAAALVTAAAVVLLPPVVETSFLAASLRQEAGTHGVQQQLLTLPGVSAAGGPAPPYQALTTAATTAAAEAASSDSEHEWAHGVVGSSGSGGGGGGGAASGGRGRGPGADGIKRRSLGAARHGRRHVLWKENGWDGDLGVQTVMVGTVLPATIRCCRPTACLLWYKFAYVKRPPARQQHVLHPQIYVKIPLYKKKVPQNRTVTAVATLWLRRMGGGQAGQYGMPHQHHDSIRGALWLEDPNDLSLSGPASHAAMPVCQDQWRPQLLLDTFAGGPPLRAAVDALPWPCTDIRPYSFSFTLPEGAGSCFKVRARTAAAYLHVPDCSRVLRYRCNKMHGSSQCTARDLACHS